MGIGYGIADGFSIAKEKSLTILQDMVNGAIGILNKFSGLINSIFGTSIEAVGAVTFGTEAAIPEQTARQSRADDLAGRKASAAAKSVNREQQLAADEIKWRQQAAAAEAEAKARQKTDGFSTNFSRENKPVTVGGGTLDRVKKVDADLSDQTLAYLYDIAAGTALQQFDALDTMVRVVYEDTEAKLKTGDKDILLAAAGQGTRIYYLNYQGGIQMPVSVKQGDSYEEIKRKAYAETETELEIGLKKVEEFVKL